MKILMYSVESGELESTFDLNPLRKYIVSRSCLDDCAASAGVSKTLKIIEQANLGS